jgi:hypothetical protein
MLGSDAIGEHALGEAPPSVALAHVNPNGISDLPTINDEIGFRPYVRAIAWFLSNEETKPPLTMSIEGPWGSGKSSFMLQLEQELKILNAEKPDHFYVKFNAWRSDKDEALWAAFVLAFIEQLQTNLNWRARIRIHIQLFSKRFEWRRSWFQLTRLALFFALLLIVTIYALQNPGIADLTKTALVTTPWLIAAHFGLEKSKKDFWQSAFI